MELNEFSFPGKLIKMFGRARERCLQLAESERLLGYADSAKDYRDIAYELETLGLWAAREIAIAPSPPEVKVKMCICGPGYHENCDEQPCLAYYR
jgi:hypothetical protein